MSRRSFARIAAPIVASALFIAIVSVIAGPQEKPSARVPGIEKAEPIPPEPPPTADEKDAWQKAGEMAEKRIAAYDLKPHPLRPIPDDPPPHEGALINLPWFIEPPDLMIVEVLEALPGRPISGERLVRPDGTISLGFYGDIQVSGLTVPQIKVAIIKRLRKFLPDDTLGLIASPDSGEFDEPAVGEPAKVRNPDVLELPPARNPFEDNEKPGPSPAGSRTAKHPAALPAQAAPPVMEQEGPWRVIPPEESLRVYVDITAYNSKNYYVLGDILVPGRLPWTGNETVLDALQFAGGLLPTAEPKDIRLIRPARGGKPARVYRVDLEAIQDQGDVRSNYQLFPGDRLVVGRNEVVKKTLEIDRLESAIGAIAGSIQRIANSIRAVQPINSLPDPVWEELVDFWAKELSRKGDLKLDEQTLREALLQRRKAAPVPQPKKQP